MEDLSDNLETSSIENELDTGAGDGNPEENNDQSLAANGEPGAGEQSNLSAQQGVVSDPNLEGKQPITSNPIESLNKTLGSFNVNGRPFEGFKSVEHAQRLIQQAYGAQQTIAAATQEKEQYTALRGPYEWLNEQCKAPEVAKVFAYMKAQPGLLQQIAKWIPEWEHTGQLNPDVLEKAALKAELERHRGIAERYTTQEQQQRQQQRDRSEVAEVTRMNAGIPLTQEQLGALALYREKGQAAYGPDYTLMDAAMELKNAGMWPQTKVSSPAARSAAAGVRGTPAAQRSSAGTRDLEAEMRAVRMNW